MELQSIALHRNVNFREECAGVLNEEWPRSLGARLHMLEKSSDKLPYSLILLGTPQDDPRSTEVIGHARLCKVHGKSDACFVESVVVRKSRRGQGYGRKVMTEAELHAKRLGMHTIYLTTHDKQDFYSHVGYSYCQPIISLGGASNLLSEQQFEQLFGSLGLSNAADGKNITNQSPTKAQSTDATGNSSINSMTNQPSPTLDKESNMDKESLSQGLDHCILVPSPPSSVPPPPPPPTPVGPPPVPLPTLTSQDITRVPMDKIYWMKKELV